MTDEEANGIAAICATADGGCPHCARDLQLQLAARFPEFEWKILDDDDSSIREDPHAERKAP